MKPEINKVTPNARDKLNILLSSSNNTPTALRQKQDNIEQAIQNRESYVGQNTIFQINEEIFSPH